MLTFYLAMIETPQEQDKFILIYNEYKDLMLNSANAILQNKFDAEDAVHEAFLRIIKNLHKIDEIFCPKTKGFVVIIVKNIAKTMYSRKNKVKTLELIDDIAGIKNNEVADEIDAKFVSECIEKLPEKYREILLVKYYNQCTISQTAKILGISQTTAEKRIQRAKQMLEAMLNEE